MAKYAVIRLQGRQYKVTEGQELLVDKIKDLKKIEPEVLLLVEEEKHAPNTKDFGVGVNVGKPVLKDAKVTLKVVKDVEKGEKIEVYHFKAKSRYRKHTGFRPQYTRVLVEKISI
jgi:large subunit ribosomal protein L21